MTGSILNGNENPFGLEPSHGNEKEKIINTEENPKAEKPVEGKRYTGKVQKFLKDRGFGFLMSDEINNEGKGIFVHYSDIDMDGYRTLVEGQAVEFGIAYGDRGMKAVGVKEA